MKTVETTDTNAAERMAEAAGQRVKSCVDASVHAVHDVSGKAREIRHNADGYVRDNAWLAIGVAAGVGILVGLLLRGRREC